MQGSWAKSLAEAVAASRSVDVSWWWVFSPLLLLPALVVAVLAGAVVVAGIFAAGGELERAWRRRRGPKP